ncbi:hypothetical protein ACSFBI_32135 [Variovorax sp. RB3P1]|uniref:hypothetical protein n=1 Tax=Variovorax sp. RB3P1 TaxID=3443732 RepID=UPI003F487FA4
MSNQPDFYESTKEMVQLRLGRVLVPEEGNSVVSFSMLTEHQLREIRAIGEASTADAAEFLLFLCTPEIRRDAIGFSKVFLEGRVDIQSVIRHFEERRARTA